jgi:N-acyl-L-homoserine lactone synthetase
MNHIKRIRYLYRNLIFWLFYKQIFNDFHFYIVTDEKEKVDIYRLRYQVYCEEYGYIDIKNHPDKLEKDEYDPYSDYLVIRDKKNEIAATVRIIRNSSVGFPIIKHFTTNLDLQNINKNNVVEISRLIVAKKYRRKQLILFLLKGLSVYAINKNISHAYCVIDEKLHPLLLKMHVPVRIIGDKQLYQGVTFPCMIVISEWIEEVRKSKIIQSFFTYKGFVFEDKTGKYVIH